MTKLPEAVERAPIPVVVLGTGITALGVQRLFGRSGIAPYMAELSDPLNRRTRWFQPLPGEPRAPVPGSLGQWLDRIPLDRAVLVPCSDAWAMAVSALDDERKARFAASVAGPEVLRKLTDKGLFAAELQTLGIPRPWSAPIADRTDLQELTRASPRRIFIKPRDSQSFLAEFGVKGFMVDTLAETQGRLEEILSKGHRVIAQEYIPGPPTHHVFIDGFVDRQGEVRALFARRRLRMYPPIFGNSTLMESVAIEDVADAVESVRLLMDRVGYRGIFSAEFKRDSRDGLSKILEVNARAWWYVEFAAHCGVDVCGMAYSDALGEPVGHVRGYAEGKTLVYPYSDWLACRDLVETGSLSWSSCLKPWLGARQPVLSARDPAPGVLGGAEILADWLVKRLRNWRFPVHQEPGSHFGSRPG